MTMPKPGRPEVVLIYPKTGMDVGSTVVPPHSLLCIAAPLHKAGRAVRIIDERRDPLWREHLAEALASDPICVGISTMTGIQIRFALAAAREVRRLTGGRVPIVWGGPHPSILPEQTLANENVDIVAIGEADVSFPELVEALAAKRPLSGVKGIGFKDGGKAVLTGPRELIDVESLLPVPWELVNVEDYVQPDFYLKRSPRTLDIGQTSRGCPFQCGFCCSASIRQRKWRAMSVEKSLDRIVGAVRRFGLSGIWIRDDEFYIDRARASAVCEGMIRNELNISWYTSGTRVDVFNKATEEQTELLKRSGAYVLKFGAESGCERILKLMSKGITVADSLKANQKARRHGIIPAFGLMVGFPTETFEEMEQTIELGLRLRRENPDAQLEAIATFTPLPATPLYQMSLKHGLKPPEDMEGWIDWEFVEYDLEGRRIPWFSRRERVKIGNICYMYTIANALPNLLDSVSNTPLRWFLKALGWPVILYCRMRIGRKSYSFAPELRILKWIRSKILYEKYIIIK